MYPQPDGFITTRQDKLFKKGNLAFELNFGPALANRVCIPCYEDEILTGVLFTSSVSGLITDHLKIKLEFGSFLENWEIFHDDSKPGSYSNNRRDMGIVSISYFPYKKPLWFSVGAGFGNYYFTPREAPLLTQQGTYTNSSIVNTGLIIQGGIGFDYLLGKNVITGIKLIPSYLFLNDLEFVTGERLANNVGSFVIGISVSFGLFIDPRQDMSANR